MKSSIFLRNITVLDHAYIDEYGFVKGRSFHISAIVTGEVESQESVVVDFSRCKKLLKSFIDDKEEGFDHKLWVYTDSNVVSMEVSIDQETAQRRTIIDTPYIHIDCPSNAISLVEQTKFTLENYLTKKMQSEFPELNINVAIEFTEDGLTNRGSYFSYSHGLKNSSSWGCQNICHGHTSFVEIDNNGVDEYFLRNDIAEYLNDAVIINRENIVEQTVFNIAIEYQSTDRGRFYVNYKIPHKWIVFDTETTIEYIIEHVAEEFKDRLKGKTLYISEGLSKGAIKRC